MTTNDRQRPQETTPEERHAKFLKEHEERMRKVDETIVSVKSRTGRVQRPRKRSVA